MKVDDAQVRIIADSRGAKTLEVSLVLDGQQAIASVPSGKSKGLSEVFVLNPDLAAGILQKIKPNLGRNFESLEEFDSLLIQLDDTPNKQNLGGNLILALSVAFAKAWAKLQNLQTFQLIAKLSKQEAKVPRCFFNLIEGGVHTSSVPLKAANLPFQEYLFIPKTNSPKISLEQANAAIKLLGSEIQKKYGPLKYGDEGGFIIPLQIPEMGLKILRDIITAGGWDVDLGLDVAASTFFGNGLYNVGGQMMDQYGLLSYYKRLVLNYKPLSIEDPFAEAEWEGFTAAMREFGETVWIVGDDITTTSVERIQLAKENQAVNAVIVKPNQIGTITETIAAAVLARSYGWKIIVSHRSGETLDAFIADLSVGLGADGLKSGCPLQRERLVKYQRLVEIENILNS